MASRLIGVSPSMRRLRAAITVAVRTHDPVLITGPSGSGKELVAREIHAHRGLGPKTFEAVNCGAIPEALAASVLFGHERGAFTGAERRLRGHLALASNGTLFLDEIAELKPAAQVMLLRALEGHPYRPLGSEEQLAFTGRVIGATHADLHEEAARARFREDLLYRLDVFSIEVPPLDERRDDIPLLVAQFVTASGGVSSFAPCALSALQHASWPGNVRQLENAVKQLLAAESVEAVDERRVAALLAKRRARSSPTMFATAVLADPRRNKLDAAKALLIDHAIQLSGGNRSQAARLLGVDRKVVERHLACHGIASDPAWGAAAGRGRRPTGPDG